jgi:hypothetical protein
MPYDYRKFCPPRELKAKLWIGIVIYTGVVTSAYTLASVYL